MQIKRFTAPTLAAAMREVRKTFGPDAVVVSARQLPDDAPEVVREGRNARFEITAARETPEAPLKRPERPEELRPDPPRSAAETFSRSSAEPFRPAAFDQRRETAAPVSRAAAAARGESLGARRLQPEMKNLLPRNSVLKRRASDEASGVEETELRGKRTASSPPPLQEARQAFRAPSAARGAAIVEQAARHDGAERPARPIAPRNTRELSAILEELKALRRKLSTEPPPAEEALPKAAPAAAPPPPVEPDHMEREPLPNHLRHAGRPTPPEPRTDAQTLNPGRRETAETPPFFEGELENATLLPIVPLRDKLLGQGVDPVLVARILARMGVADACDDPRPNHGPCTFERFMTVVHDFAPPPRPAQPPAPRGGPRRVVLVGPTGVGKTTTLAKLASHHALNRGRKVALATMDTYRVAAVDQLKTYGRLLGVPVAVVEDHMRLERVFAEYADWDMVFVDTPGHSPYDEAALSRLSRALGRCEALETHLVTPAALRGEEIRLAMQRFAPMRYEAVVFSKTDEASAWGDLLNAWIMGGRRVSYFTTGQRVPEDLEAASLETLCKGLLQA